jgi:carbon-monoxide dehydrogenase medium subunit
MKFPKEMTKTLKEFGYFDPYKIEDAISILRKFGNRVVVLAGGTDILNQMKLRNVIPEFILNIKNIQGLGFIRQNKGLEIGTLTTIAAIKESVSIRQEYISIYEAANWFGTPQIRNMATVGGNVCRSSPSSDMIASLMVLDAILKLAGPNGERDVPIEEFVLGPSKNVLDHEILTRIIVPQQKKYSGTAFRKLTRGSVDLAKVSCAVRILVSNGKCTDIRIVLGAVAEKTFRAKGAEEVIRGEKISDAVIEEVAKRAIQEVQPITDVRSTGYYRRLMVEVLVRRMVNLSIERARGKGGEFS